MNETKPILVTCSMWSNPVQDYLPVGTLVYDSKRQNSISVAGFVYHEEYVRDKWPAIDPAHFQHGNDPQKRRFPKVPGPGKVPYYFSEFLPGEFGQQLLSEVDNRWGNLSDSEQLYVMTLAHGDFGALQLNPQEDQYNEPLRDLDQLSNLVQAIRDYQKGVRPSPMTHELRGALCSFHGPKPKVDYEEEKDGIARRFVAKLNTTGYYNDARIAATFTQCEKNAGIATCENRVMPLKCGEEVLFSYNYSRTEKYKQHDDGEKYRLILKYNRISFKTLLAEDPVLPNTQRPQYKHIAHAIDLYSANPLADKEELFRRAVLSAATNHTANGLDNMEMYDKGQGEWRLSPSFHNLPNPMQSAEYDVSFDGKVMTGGLLKLDEAFLCRLGGQMGLSEIDALALANPVIAAVNNIDRTMNMYDVSDNDRATIHECIHSREVESLNQRLSENERVQQHLAKKLCLPETQVGTVKPSGRSPSM